MNDFSMLLKHNFYVYYWVCYTFAAEFKTTNEQQNEENSDYIDGDHVGDDVGKAENANVRVVNKDNQTTLRPNVRLAVDNVDYYVPLEIKDGQLLDIIFYGDRRTKAVLPIIIPHNMVG